MHFSLKFENLDPRIEVVWSDLRRIVEMAETIYPKLDVQVDIEIKCAPTFFVDPYREVIYPKEPVKVILVPSTDVRHDDINPQYSSIVNKLVSMIVRFLAVSSPLNDSSVQPSYFPPTEIEISAGFGVSKFVNGKPD